MKVKMLVATVASCALAASWAHAAPISSAQLLDDTSISTQGPANAASSNLGATDPSMTSSPSDPTNAGTSNSTDTGTGDNSDEGKADVPSNSDDSSDY